MFLFYILIFQAFAFFYLFKCCDTPQKRLYYVLTEFVILGTLIMLRGADVGNDTDIYTALFEDIIDRDNFSFYITESRYEKGYIVLNKAIGLFTKDVQFLLIITGFITSVLFALFIYQYSADPLLSIIMFITLQFLDVAMSGVRQILAIAILTISYDCIIKNRKVLFLITILLASLIHSSSILFGTIYLFSLIKNKKILYSVLFLSSVGIFLLFSNVLAFINRITPGYMNYFIQSTNSYSNTLKSANILMFLLYAIFLAIIIILNRNSRPELLLNTDDTTPVFRNYDKIKQISFISIFIATSFLFFSFHATILNRYKYVFGFPILIQYPNSLYMSSFPNRKILAFISILVFVFYSLIIYIYRPEWQSTYPYSFFWETPYYYH